MVNDSVTGKRHRVGLFFVSEMTIHFILFYFFFFCTGRMTVLGVLSAAATTTAAHNIVHTYSVVVGYDQPTAVISTRFRGVAMLLVPVICHQCTPPATAGDSLTLLSTINVYGFFPFFFFFLCIHPFPLLAIRPNRRIVIITELLLFPFHALRIFSFHSLSRHKTR
jgi:hypothetical protein